MNKNLDQITLDIIKDSLQAIGEELFIAIAKCAKSPLIYEVLDYASGITDAQGRLLTQGNGNAGFIGMLGPMVEEVIKRFTEKGDIAEGDVIVCNDPYSGGGSHLSDVGLVMPIYYKGELVAYTVNKAHWTDIGGKNPGSFSTDATEVFQEGLSMPFVKIQKAGEMVNDIYRMIESNTRTPDDTMGDMMAQIAGLKTGSKRIIELYDKFGRDVVQAAIEKFLESSKKVSIENVRNIPEGIYTAEDVVDSDGLSDPIKIKVKITIKDGKFIVDFTGSDPQTTRSINCPFSALMSGVKMVFLSATDPNQEINDGVFYPLEVIAEKGSILNCQRPAPVSIPWESQLIATDTMVKALAPVIPHKLLAACHSTVGSFIFEVLHPETRRYNINCAAVLAGWGAGQDLEGQNAQFCMGNGETYMIPAELLETTYGFHVESYALLPTDAGAGEFRGGLGITKKYRMRSDGSYYLGIIGRHTSKPWGLNGGGEGSNNYYEIFKADGSKVGPTGIIHRTHLAKDDVLHTATSTGGGYGNPLDRTLEKVVMDVKNEYISIGAAKSVYGVIIDPDTLQSTGITDARKQREQAAK